MSRYSGRVRHPRLKRRTPSPPPPSLSLGGHHHSHSHPAPRYTPYHTTLLVRRLSHITRPMDLRIPFENFGPLSDVYLPKNYHTGKPTGFGFVKYRNANDAAEAKHHMNNQIICGNQISVIFSKDDAKHPEQMLAKEHNS